tara:strand:+ start:843 stop:1298 length:456 start_codon:yes stop_codon:yes gene_type:complete
MFQYYFSDINIHKLHNDIIIKLKNNFSCNEFNENIILYEKGFYKVIDDKMFHFSLSDHINKEEIFHDNLKTTLIKQNYPFIKNKFENCWIPLNHENIQLKKYIFKTSPKSRTSLHIECFNNKINDIYILSNSELNQYIFEEDLELFYRNLI